MAIFKAVCAYCGTYADTEPEHVVPRCLAPPEVRDECAWVRVRACSSCNRQFSADESDFREFCIMAGSRDENALRDKVFHEAVTRNWRRTDGRGKGALRRMANRIRLPEGGLSNPNDARIIPDEKTFRIVRKIVRGLYFHHFTPKRGLAQVLPDMNIRAEPVFYHLSEEVYSMQDWHVVHPSVFQYGFVECGEEGLELPGIDSLWLLNAFRGATFFATVRSNAFPWVGTD